MSILLDTDGENFIDDHPDGEIARPSTHDSTNIRRTTTADTGRAGMHRQELAKLPSSIATFPIFFSMLDWWNCCLRTAFIGAMRTYGECFVMSSSWALGMLLIRKVIPLLDLSCPIWNIGWTFLERKERLEILGLLLLFLHGLVVIKRTHASYGVDISVEYPLHLNDDLLQSNEDTTWNQVAPTVVHAMEKLDDSLLQEILSFNPETYRYTALVNKQFFRTYKRMIRAGPCVTSYASAVQNIRTVEVWLTDGNGEYDDEACDYAARYGQLEVLKYLRSRGCSWSANTCAMAAKYGHLDILQWARAMGCDWGTSTCSLATENGHMDLWKWAMQHECPWDTKTMTKVRTLILDCWSAIMIHGHTLAIHDKCLNMFKDALKTYTRGCSIQHKGYILFKSCAKLRQHVSAEIAEACEGFANCTSFLTDPPQIDVGNLQPLESPKTMTDEDPLQTITENLHDIVLRPQITFRLVSDALAEASKLVEMHKVRIVKIEGELTALTNDYASVVSYSTKLTKAVEKAFVRVSEIWPKYAVRSASIAALPYPDLLMPHHDIHNNTHRIAHVFSGCPQLLEMVQRHTQILESSTMSEIHDNLFRQLEALRVNFEYHDRTFYQMMDVMTNQFLGPSSLDSRRKRRMRHRRRKKRGANKEIAT